MSSPDQPEAAQKRVLATLPVPSTALLDSPVLHSPGGSLDLRLRYRTDAGPVIGGLRFLVVRSFRKRAEGHCTAWHVTGAFDTLVEVIPSDWVEQLRRDQGRPPQPTWQMHHYLIFLDGAGAFEAVAADWEWLPEEPG